VRAIGLRRLEQVFWSAHSRTWDDALDDPAVAAHVAELADRLAAAVAAGGRVADLGCGTGNHSLALAGRGLTVVGVDVAPGMLDHARAKSLDTPVFLVRADLRGPLPMADDSVAGVLSVYAAQFLELAPFLAEVARVLEPGGALVLELPQPTQPTRDLSALSLRFRAFQRVKRVLAAVGLRTGRVRWHSPTEVRRALDAAGFGDVTAVASPAGLAVLARLT
jgi:SAM-dependent methyltransferase